MTHWRCFLGILLVFTLLGCAQAPAPAPVPLAAQGQTCMQQLAQPEALLQQQRWAKAEALLPAQPPQPLEANCVVKHALLHSELAHQRGDDVLRLNVLSQQKMLNTLAFAQPALVLSLRQARADALEQNTQYLAAASERLKIMPLLPAGNGTALRANEDALWRILMDMPVNELGAGMALPAGRKQAETERAWFALALTLRQPQMDAAAQRQALSVWAGQYPAHAAARFAGNAIPAAHPLPTRLPVVQGEVRIAVFLPETGKLQAAAQALREGLLAATYALPQPPALRFYNTEGRTWAQLLASAQQDGATLGIGPLEKERLAELAQLPQLPFPILALNTQDAPALAPQLYQLGFASDDETQQLATTAWQQGARAPVVVAPNTAQGDRQVAHFSRLWQGMGGTAPEVFRFGATEDYSAFIKRALHMRPTEASATGKPRWQRGSSADCVILLVSAEAGSQIQPQLKYYFAQDLPLLAGSSLYAGAVGNRLTLDLSGISFLTLPWYYAPVQQEKAALNQGAPSTAATARLQALGVDALRLSLQLNLLQGPYDGYTGRLALNAQRQFERQHSWAMYSTSGQYQPLAAPQWPQRLPEPANAP